MTNFLIQVFGVLFIWIAIHLGRKEDSKIQMWSTDFWSIVLLVTAGLIIYKIPYLV